MSESKSRADDKPSAAQDAAETTGDKKNPDNKQEPMSKRLDEALEETFPSSDPVSVKITK